MRRVFAILVLLALVAAVPIIGMASDIKDGQACGDSEQGASVEHAILSGGDPTTSELDRGAICVSDGDSSNGADVYLGGELQAEEEGDPAFGGACGAIVLGGDALSGNPDWDNPGPDATPGTGDDEHCD